MEPAIPFAFNPDSSHFIEHHLAYDKTAAGTLVSWPLGGVKLAIPKGAKHEDYPDFSEIESANGNLVKFHGHTGFTVGSYHEFFVERLDALFGFKMGNVEVSFGAATPLAAYLFDVYHREKYFGPWSDIVSMRIIGASLDMAEAVFINAAVRYDEKFGYTPTSIAIDLSLIYDIFDTKEAEYTAPTVVRQDPAIKDIDPLRFYYYGITQKDDTSACIYFYRVLEYYSFLMYDSQITRIRHDRSLSDTDFSKKVLEILARDEKSPFVRLISQVADHLLIEMALTSGLISSNDAGLLGVRIYEFRNSIVHGKHNFGYKLQSNSVIGESADPIKWRNFLRSIARKAMDTYGTRLI